MKIFLILRSIVLIVGLNFVASCQKNSSGTTNSPFIKSVSKKNFENKYVPIGNQRPLHMAKQNAKYQTKSDDDNEYYPSKENENDYYVQRRKEEQRSQYLEDKIQYRDTNPTKRKFNNQEFHSYDDQNNSSQDFTDSNENENSKIHTRNDKFSENFYSADRFKQSNNNMNHMSIEDDSESKYAQNRYVKNNQNFKERNLYTNSQIDKNKYNFNNTSDTNILNSTQDRVESNNISKSQNNIQQNNQIKSNNNSPQTIQDNNSSKTIENNNFTKSSKSSYNNENTAQKKSKIRINKVIDKRRNLKFASAFFIKYC